MQQNSFLHLFVNTPLNNILSLRGILSHSSVCQLKAEIELRTGIPGEQQRVHFIDQCLKDHLTLLQAGLRNGCILRVQLKEKSVEKLYVTAYQGIIDDTFRLGIQGIDESEAANEQDLKIITDWNKKATQRAFVALFAACHSGKVNLVSEIMKTSAVNIDDVTRNGRSALHLSAFCGSIGCICILLNEGMDGSIKDEENKTALDLASENGNIHCEKKLWLHQWSLTNVGSSKTNAGSSKTNAGSSNTNAGSSKTNAGSSNTNSGSSNTNSGSFRTNADSKNTCRIGVLQRKSLAYEASFVKHNKPNMLLRQSEDDQRTLPVVTSGLKEAHNNNNNNTNIPTCKVAFTLPGISNHLTMQQHVKEQSKIGNLQHLEASIGNNKNKDVKRIETGLPLCNNVRSQTSGEDKKSQFRLLDNSINNTAAKTVENRDLSFVELKTETEESERTRHLPNNGNIANLTKIAQQYGTVAWQSKTAPSSHLNNGRQSHLNNGRQSHLDNGRQSPLNNRRQSNTSSEYEHKNDCVTFKTTSKKVNHVVMQLPSASCFSPEDSARTEVGFETEGTEFKLIETEGTEHKLIERQLQLDQSENDETRVPSRVPSPPGMLSERCERTADGVSSNPGGNTSLQVQGKCSLSDKARNNELVPRNESRSTLEVESDEIGHLSIKSMDAGNASELVTQPAEIYHGKVVDNMERNHTTNRAFNLWLEKKRFQGKRLPKQQKLESKQSPSSDNKAFERWLKLKNASRRMQPMPTTIQHDNKPMEYQRIKSGIAFEDWIKLKKSQWLSKDYHAVESAYNGGQGRNSHCSGVTFEEWLKMKCEQNMSEIRKQDEINSNALVKSRPTLGISFSSWLEAKKKQDQIDSIERVNDIMKNEFIQEMVRLKRMSSPRCKTYEEWIICKQFEKHLEKLKEKRKENREMVSYEEDSRLVFDMWLLNKHMQYINTEEEKLRDLRKQVLLN